MTLYFSENLFINNPLPVPFFFSSLLISSCISNAIFASNNVDKEGKLTHNVYSADKGGYIKYLFGGTSSKGVMNIVPRVESPIAQVKNTPQYLNASVNMTPIGLVKNDTPSGSASILLGSNWFSSSPCPNRPYPPFPKVHTSF